MRRYAHLDELRQRQDDFVNLPKALEALRNRIVDYMDWASKYETPPSDEEEEDGEYYYFHGFGANLMFAYDVLLAVGITWFWPPPKGTKLPKLQTKRRRKRKG